MRRRRGTRKRGGTRTQKKYNINSAQRTITRAWRNSLTRKSRASPTFEDLAQRYGLTNYMPPGAKYVTNPRLQPSTSFYRWLALKDEIMATPIYLVTCHSNICNSPEQCRTPKMVPAGKSPEFIIPKSTYVINVTAGGEYCMFSNILVTILSYLRNEFRKFLLVDSKADIIVDHTDDIHPLLYQSNRATEVEYPNIFCTFWDDDPKERKYLGVFPLDKIVGKKLENINNIEDSVIQTMEPGFHEIGHWFLNELIAETYKRTNTTSGIFIFTGCTGPLSDDGSELTIRAMASAQTLIYQGETSYSSIKPTLDADTLKKNNLDIAIPRDVGTYYPLEIPSATEIYALEKAGMNATEGARAENINAARKFGKEQ